MNPQAKSPAALPPLPYGRQMIGSEELAAVERVLRSDWLTQGPDVGAFEREVAEVCGARFALACSSGTAALHCAYEAAGLGAGTELVTTPITFLATANAAHVLGGRAVFADVQAQGAPLLDPQSADAACTPRTRALVPVDYAGHPCDYDAFRALARRRGLLLIADACHSLGARYHDRPVGALADMTVLSFHPVKHITTGEGGMVLTDNADLHQRLLAFRNHGMLREPARLERPDEGAWYYEMHGLGLNYRITDLQCALGRAQLARLPAFVERRRALAQLYAQALASVPGVAVLAEPPGTRSSYHLFPIRVAAARRRGVFDSLRAAGILAQVHYIPVHTQPYYRQQGWHAGQFPHAERYYAETLSLPLFPGLRDSDVERVVAAVRAALA
ncbi:MAG: UDP-4-amino-4,6-dideoxy-N-acetyl-beta-L-altrosamine transaminase [Planctomycetota bacterium]